MSEPLGRQKSSFREVSDYTLAADNGRRGPDYLHCIRALGKDDVALLKHVAVEVPKWLNQHIGIETTEMGCHYPYADEFSTLHIHFMSDRYPNKGQGSTRGYFHLSDMIEMLEQDGDALRKCLICGLLSPVFLTLDWFGKMKQRSSLEYSSMDVSEVDGVLHLKYKSSKSGAPSSPRSGTPLLSSSAGNPEESCISTASTADDTTPANGDIEEIRAMSKIGSLYETTFLPAVLQNSQYFTGTTASAILQSTIRATASAVVVDDSPFDQLQHLQSIRVIAVVGPPAVGKDTALKPLCSLHRWIHVSSGNLMRMALANASLSRKNSICSKLKRLSDKASSAPTGSFRDNLWSKLDTQLGLLLILFLLQCPPNSVVVFDNYPRSIHDLEYLLGHNVNFIGYVHIQLESSFTWDSLVDRMAKRGREARDADRALAMKRVDNYFNMIEPGARATQQRLQAHGVPICAVRLSEADTPAGLVSKLIASLDENGVQYGVTLARVRSLP